MFSRWLRQKTQEREKTAGIPHTLNTPTEKKRVQHLQLLRAYSQAHTLQPGCSGGDGGEGGGTTVGWGVWGES